MLRKYLKNESAAARSYNTRSHRAGMTAAMSSMTVDKLKQGAIRREERYAAATSRALKVCKQRAFRTRSGTRQSRSTSVSGHIGGQPTGHKSLSYNVARSY
jgi:hypothetical protein